MTRERQQSVVRVALHEIERLLNRADASGAPVEDWLEEMAAELRTAMPELDPEAARRIARLMLSEPRRSIAAQGRVGNASLAALKR